MKTEHEIDAIMNQIPADWRNHWCENGPCACIGCVRMGNHHPMPRITKEEWLNWRARQTPNKYIDSTVT